jgi:hypothetical protein
VTPADNTWNYVSFTFTTKVYRTVSTEAAKAIAGIMPLDLAMLLYKDIRALR